MRQIRDRKLSIEDIVRMAGERHCKITRLCKLAKIPRATFYRRKENPGLMTMAEYGRLIAALNTIGGGKPDENA